MLVFLTSLPFTRPPYLLSNVSSGSSKICLVLAGAVTVNSVLGLRVLVQPLHQRTVLSTR